MERGVSGRYEPFGTVAERVHAFVPDSLPPAPPLALDGARQRLLERALLACGRLDYVRILATTTPDADAQRT